MQLISLELGKDQFYWSLDEVITLTQDSKTSDLFDLEQLTDETKKTIEDSIRTLAIKAFTSEGTRIYSISSANFIDGELAVSLADIKKDSCEYEIKEITVSNEDEEEEEEIQPSDADFSAAKKLLQKNGNTIKKYLKSLEVTKDKILFLNACLSVEHFSKTPRHSIIELLEELLND